MVAAKRSIRHGRGSGQPCTARSHRSARRSAAAGLHTCHFRNTTNAALAEIGIARTINKFTLTIGLAIMARGAVIKPNRGLSVFCARFTPVGAYMALLKNGFRPWASAWDTQPLNHTDNVQSGKCRRGVAISRVDRPEWHDAKQEVPNNDGYRKCGQPAPPENSGSSLLGCHRRGDHVAAYRHDCGRWLTNDRKIRALRGPIAFSRRVSSPAERWGCQRMGWVLVSTFRG